MSANAIPSKPSQTSIVLDWVFLALVIVWSALALVAGVPVSWLVLPWAAAAFVARGLVKDLRARRFWRDHPELDALTARFKKAVMGLSAETMYRAPVAGAALHVRKRLCDSTKRLVEVLACDATLGSHERAGGILGQAARRVGGGVV